VGICVSFSEICKSFRHSWRKRRIICTRLFNIHRVVLSTQVLLCCSEVNGAKRG
jgi:hypothetical protein